MPKRSCVIHLREITHEVSEILTIKFSVWEKLFKITTNLQDTGELNHVFLMLLSVSFTLYRPQGCDV